MDALEKAKQSMAWKEEWHGKANREADEGKRAHQAEMEDLCRADAAVYAAIAQATALEKIASSLCMGNDLNVIDALYAVVEALTKTIRGV